MSSTQVNLAATLRLRGLKHRLPSQREEPPNRVQECFKGASSRHLQGMIEGESQSIKHAGDHMWGVCVKQSKLF
ncbi:hypothetical protein CVIRNUC_007079 [Coccomyxa viridis]|uniref:Uncharacterized protein n=1 Tax=Coccomyxa viridis TaxID=1274662 RepID=A0AAV1I9Y3_9CHLO|nr:hypothetical protein CVIRNUC_007079 [Coccomyxa viridis]